MSYSSILPSSMLPNLPRKPYIHPGIEPTKEARSMTIAAGFRCKDGEILCSDTQITQASGKTYESKIFPIKDDADCLLAYSGDVGYIKEFVGELKEIAAKESNDKLIHVIKSHYRRFHHKYFTQAPKAERAFAQILVTVNKDDKIYLYIGDGRHFYPVDNRQSIGTGGPYLEPFFRDTDFTTLFMDHAAKLIIYALQRTKDYAEFVGGKTKIISINDDDIFGPPSYYEMKEHMVKHIEAAYDNFDEKIRPLFLDLPFMSPEDLTKSLKSVSSELRKYRATQMKELRQKYKRKS
jgi:20S proteasome alpha/beta subunit